MSRVYLVMGEAGTGKSTFAGSGEGIKPYFEWDIGSFERTGLPDEDFLLHQYRSPLTNLLGQGKLSVGAGGGISPSTVHKLEGWKEAFWCFVEDYLNAVQSDASTIVIDTATKLWLAVRQAFLQEVQEATGQEKERLSQLQYTEPNARMTQIVEAAKIGNKDLILTTHEKEVYQNDKPTGVITADGFKELPGLADCTLRFSLKNKKPVATVYKAGTGGLELIGMEIEEPTLAKANDLIDAATKLRRAGKAVPGSYDQVLVAALSL